MAARKARILFKDRPAGLLEEVGGGTIFTYDPHFGETIACALPREEGAFTTPAGLHAVFQHLGPEGWLRERQARAGLVQQEDDLGLLLRYGRDCIGAISVEPIDGSDADAPTVVTADAVERSTTAHRTVSGVQKKLLCHFADGVYQPSGPDDPATHIAKFPSADQPDLVRNENLCLRLAARVLGASAVTTHGLATVQGVPGIALVVKRFDRTPAGEKLRMEDFAQVLARPRGPDFGGKYVGSFEEVGEVLRKHSSRPIIDVALYFDAVVFNFVIGNADAHLKNWSLLETGTGLRLSPLYDLLCTTAYGGTFDTRTALDIGGRRSRLDEIGHQDVFDFGVALGLPPKAVLQRLTALVQRISKAPELNPSGAIEEGGIHDRIIQQTRTACSRILEK